MGGFSGALVHGLLGGIAGGADRYIKEDEERRKAELKKYEEEAAQMREQANMRLRVQLSEESAIRTENRAKETKEAERGERAGLLQSYAKQATELSDREINLGKVDDKYESFNRVADQATLDAQPEIATSLKEMAGTSPAARREQMIKQGKTLAEIAKIESDIKKAGFYDLSEGQARFDENNKMVASRGKTFAPDRSGGDSGKDKAEEAKTVKSYFTKTVQRLAGEGKGIKDVTEFDAASYSDFTRWLAATGREGNLSSYNAWVADGKGTAPRGNKQPVAKTRGNMPTKQRSLKDIFGR